jgi:hypothetical protein
MAVLRGGSFLRPFLLGSEEARMYRPVRSWMCSYGEPTLKAWGLACPKRDDVEAMFVDASLRCSDSRGG